MTDDFKEAHGSIPQENHMRIKQGKQDNYKCILNDTSCFEMIINAIY